MWHYAIKIGLTAVLVVVVSEVAKRSTFWAAALASLPLTSLLAFVWLYLDTHDTARVAALSVDILWLVLPSLVLFVMFPLLLRAGWNFWLGLTTSCAATALAYAALIFVLARIGTRS